eukprot:scaffold67387_cov39-Phaeocystis_antarctica.AAC.1
MPSSSWSYKSVFCANGPRMPDPPTGYGLKYRGARMQPLTRGPEADETKTMTVAWPHHACVPLSERRQHHPVRSTCAAAFSVRSSPLGANT